ncbi:TPA: magnesium/cobalt transporter CorA [Candidatus Micrarchaeota archaeon]|nr:magnesium/cobalt transporter CorA [Candidatus Micrarchaeota archaeon]
MIRAFAAFGRKVREIRPAEAKKFIHDRKHNVWINFEKPTEKENDFLKSLEFHPLSVEDTIKGLQRPKIDDYEDYGYIVIRTLETMESGKTAQMSIFLGKTFIVTYASSLAPSLERVMNGLKEKPNILTRGHDFLAYSVMDAIVDDFFPVLDKLDEEVEDLEEEIFASKSSPKIISKLFRLRRKVVEIRRIVWPTRDILNILSRRDYAYINSKNALYFRDVYDHLIRITDATDTLRELITSAMEGYLTVVSNNLNFVVKRLTAITVILMVPTLIASIYGMNVINLPLAQEGGGFFEIMGIIILFTILSFYYFRQQEWL